MRSGPCDSTVCHPIPHRRKHGLEAAHPMVPLLHREPCPTTALRVSGHNSECVQMLSEQQEAEAQESRGWPDCTGPEFLSSGSMFWPRAWSPNPGILLFRTRRRGLSGPERGSAGTASLSVSHREGTGRNRGHSATGVENQAQDEIPQKMEKKVFVSDSPREDSRKTLSAYP